MASIQVRKDKKKPYRVQWRDLNTRKQRSKSFLRRKDANVFIQSLLSADNTITRSNPNVTMSDALDRWYTLCTTTGRGGREPVERSTAEKYDSHRKIIKDMIGAGKLINMDRKACEDFRDALLGKYSRPYAKKILVSFKSSIIQAVSDNLLPFNPATDVHILISRRQKNANRVQIPELREVHKLTKTIDALMASPNEQIRQAWSRYGVMFYTQMYSGMRPTEVRGLPWKDVDWKRGGINITQDADAYGEIGLLKSGASYRYVPLPTFIMQMLKDWQPHCPQGMHNLVFPNWSGNIENHANITRRGWYVLCESADLTQIDDAGIKRSRFRLNCLRHIKASLEITLGRTPKRIQQIMGHEDIKLTFDTYGHLFEDEALQDDPNDLHKLISTVAQMLPEKSQAVDVAQ